MTRATIFTEIDAERTYQDNKWGHQKDDAINAPNDWISYISHYATTWFPGGFSPYDKTTIDAFRISMVKVAALAVAAIESVDRQRSGQSGETFYEN